MTLLRNVILDTIFSVCLLMDQYCKSFPRSPRVRKEQDIQGKSKGCVAGSGGNYAEYWVVRSVVCSVLCSMQCAVYCAVCSVQCVVQYAVCSVLCSMQCAVCSVYYAPCNIHPTSVSSLWCIFSSLYSVCQTSSFERSKAKKFSFYMVTLNCAD